MTDHSDEDAEFDRRVNEAVEEALALRDDTPLARLYSLIASHLSERQASVRLRDPSGVKSGGDMMPGPNGKVCIDLEPGLDPDLQFEVFLHECAHAKLHYKSDVEQWVFMAGITMQPRSMASPPGRLEDPRVAQEEKEAADLGGVWNRWATKNMDPSLPPVIGKLKALFSYVE